MSKFKPADFPEPQVKQESMAGAVRVMKIEGNGEKTISEFAMPKLGTGMAQANYAATKAKYGALAATDPDRKARSTKDQRFSLSPLLRDPLSVEEEERRAISERVKIAVEEVAEKTRKEAHQIGYQDGLSKGFKEAFAAFQQEGDAKLMHLESLIDGFESSKAEIYRANERFLIETVFRVARMVALKEISADKDYLSRLTHDLIERVGVRENIRIRVSQQDAESIARIRESLEKKLGTLKNVNIEASKDVKLGGCIVETEWNMIDATIETQLQGIYDSVVGKSE